MVNQPGYQMPGQSNATASGNQNYQQNVIEGAGFAPSFFGTQGAGAQSGQLMSNAATSLLGSQFQAPGQQVGQVQLGAQANQMAGSAGLFGNQGAQAMSGELGTPDQVQTTSEVQSPGPLTPQIKGKQVIGVTEKYSEYGGPYVVVMYGDGSVEEIYEEGPFGGDKKNYNAAKQMAAGGMTGAALGDQFGAIGRYVSPAENELNNLRNRDVTSALRNQLAMQLTALENEQGQAQRQQAARQRGLGFSGISGMDTSGINLMYGQTAGQIQQGALQAIDDAEEAKRISLRDLEKEVMGDEQSIIQTNTSYVQSVIDTYNINADNASTDSLYVGVNPNMISELQYLKGLAATNPVTPQEFARLVNLVISRYQGNDYVSANQVKDTLL